MTRLRSAGRRRTGRAIRAVNEMAQQAAREERMIELMIDAFGASAEERKRLEALIRSQFPETVARLQSALQVFRASIKTA